MAAISAKLPAIKSEWIISATGQSPFQGDCPHTTHVTLRLDVRDISGNPINRLVQAPNVYAFHKAQLQDMLDGTMRRPSNFTDDLLGRGIEAITEAVRRDKTGNLRMDVI